MDIDIEYSQGVDSCDSDEYSEYNYICSEEQEHDSTPPDLKNTKLLNQMTTDIQEMKEKNIDDSEIYNYLKAKYYNMCDDFYFVIEILALNYNSDDDIEESEMDPYTSDSEMCDNQDYISQQTTTLDTDDDDDDDIDMEQD